MRRPALGQPDEPGHVGAHGGRDRDVGGNPLHVDPRRPRRGRYGHASSRPSWQISSVSIATSLFFALRVGPSHLHGQPAVNFHSRAFLRDSSSSVIDPERRWVWPLMTFFRHSHSSVAVV